MEAFLIYIGKSALAAAAFYIAYLVLFQNKKQFVFNRIYLPASLALSFVIPLITFTKVEYVEPISSTFDLSRLNYLLETGEEQSLAALSLEWFHYVFAIYAVVMAGFLFYLILGYFKAVSIVKKSTEKALFEAWVNITFKDVHPFSFFNKIVISDKILNDPNLGMIIRHEKIHVKEKHTIDILVGEILFLLQWFNPFAWLIKDAMKNNLEYKTDAQIIKNHDPKVYQLAMLALADKEGVAPFLNALNGSQLKSRIIMMKQKTENKYAIVKQLLVLPILALLVMGLSSKEVKTEYVEQNNETKVLALDTSASYQAKIEFESDEAELEQDKIRLKGSAESGVKIRVRDTSNSPLIILDGKEIKSVNDVDPDSIAKVEILKNKSAMELNDKKGENGVVLITSKSKQKKIVQGFLNPGSVKIISKGLEQDVVPLYVVDGKEVESILDVSPGNIQKVDVLKSESATALYGEKGKNGVVLITTKKLEDVKVVGYGKMKDIDSKVKLKIPDGENSPLYILDGKEVDSIENLDPDSIESISVLKDKSATELYGEKGKDGVIVITSKKKYVDGEPDIKVKLKSIKLDSDKEPLITLDGEKIESMEDLDPDVIESISVLKGASAIEKYGESGKNGVVELELKNDGKISSEIELRKFIASTIKYPAEARKANQQETIQLYMDINKKGEITNIKEESTIGDLMLNEIVVVAYKTDVIKQGDPESIKESFVNESKRVVDLIPEIKIQEFLGKTVGVTIKFVLQ